MKSERLLDAIGMVGEDLILEAKAPRKRHLNWKQWTAMAACLALLITVLSIVKPFQPGQPDITGPGILQTNPNTIPTTSPSDPTEPPCNIGPIRQVSASPETGYIGSAPYNPSSSSAFPNFLFSNVTVKAIEIMPHTYTYYDSWAQSSYRLVKMKTINDFQNVGFPQNFYLIVPEKEMQDFTKYDALVLHHLEQISIEGSVLYNKTIGAAEAIDCAIFQLYGKVEHRMYAYNDDLLDYNFISSITEHTQAKPTLQEMEELMLKHCFWCDEDPGICSRQTLSDDIYQEALDYITPFKNGIFAPVGSLSFRRYINGIPTNERVYFWIEPQNALHEGEPFTEADMNNLPDVASAISAVEESIRKGEITPPHIAFYQDLILRSHGVTGWYFKSDGKVYAAIQGNWGYSEAAQQIYLDWYNDDIYFIMEAGSDEYRHITRDALLKLQGTTDFIYTGEYNEQGKVPPDVYY